MTLKTTISVKLRLVRERGIKGLEESLTNLINYLPKYGMYEKYFFFNNSDLTKNLSDISIFGILVEYPFSIKHGN